MNATSANIFNALLIFVEQCMLPLLADGFFRKKRSSRFAVVSFLLLTAFICITLFFTESNTVLKICISTIISVIWVNLCYETTFVKALFTCLLWLAFLTVGDNTCLSVLSAFTEKGLPVLMEDPIFYYFICFSAKAAELFLVVMIHTWTKRHFIHSYSTVWNWLRMILFPATMLFVSICLFRIYTFAPNMERELAICNAIVVFVDIISIFLLNSLEQQQEAVRDNIILRQNMKTELDNIEAWRKAYDGQRKQTHDFQNQLLVIYGLVKEQAPKEEILAYIKRLQNVELPGTMMVKTHRTVVDIILNQKYAIAESREIRLLSQLDDLSAFPLSDDALIIVLSNLIDNAIEACSKIENADERFISLKMKVEQMAAFLYIENPTKEPVHIVNNRIVTTKKDPLEHGYGLQNIASVLEQNNAVYLLNYNKDKHVFSFSAQIATEQ